jgi:hypothetical protein
VCGIAGCYQQADGQKLGNYDEVRCEVSKYIQEGFRTFILDVPPSREEPHRTAIVFVCAN